MSMITNERLEDIRKNPNIHLSSDEICRMAKEILDARKFIAGKLASYNFHAELGTMEESSGTSYWVVLKNAHGETITPYRTPTKQNAEYSVNEYNNFFRKGQLHNVPSN